MNTKSETPRSRLPLVTLALAAFALCIQFLGEPALGILEWRERASVVAEPMRIFTGHLCHWSWNHLAWDLGMFVILGAIVERRGRARMVATLVATSLVTHALLRWGGGYVSYRGLSAWAMALYALAMLEIVRAGARRGSWGVAALGGAGWLLALAKCGAELAAGEALFASDGPVAFRVAVESHAAGLLAPLAVAGLATVAKVVSRRASRARVVEAASPARRLRTARLVVSQ